MDAQTAQAALALAIGVGTQTDADVLLVHMLEQEIVQRQMLLESVNEIRLNLGKLRVAA